MLEHLRTRSTSPSRIAAALVAAISLLASCGVSDEEAASAPQATGVSPSDAGSRDVVIVFKDGGGDAARAAVEKRNGRVKRGYVALPMLAATLPADRIAELAADPDVAWIDEDVRLQALDAAAEYGAAWGVSRIGAGQVHALGVDGGGVQVAVLDTGIDYLHPDLAPAYAGGVDIAYGDGDPMDDSSDGHGTHVAGIIAAALDGAGVVGAAPGASIHAVKVLDGGGFGQTSWIIAGLDWAMTNGMQVVNMSFGTTAADPELGSLKEACARAKAAGIVLVAGTGRRSTDPVSFPAAYDSVIGVSATDASDQIAVFSPQGPEVSLVAPGVGIMSTQQQGLYQSLSGTSQAAPHVAGAVALALSRGVKDLDADGLVASEVTRLLELTAQDLGPAGRDDAFGRGLVDAAAAVSSCLEGDIVVGRARRGSSKVQELSFVPGSYRLVIENSGLTSLGVSVYEGTTLRSDLSGELSFRSGPQSVSLDVDVAAGGRIELRSEGKRSASARVSLLGKSCFPAPVSPMPLAVEAP